MNRRRFLQAAAGAGLASVAYADDKPRRVGMIGRGGDGKIDVRRLVQVAPVEIVSLCDVDSKMLSEAADIIASRQASKKRPRLFKDYRDAMISEIGRAQ